MGAPRTPQEETPPHDAAVPLQRGAIRQDGLETGAFSYVGHATVHVGGAGQTSFVPAPPVSDKPSMCACRALGSVTRGNSRRRSRNQSRCLPRGTSLHRPLRSRQARRQTTRMRALPLTSEQLARAIKEDEELLLLG